MCDLTTNDGVMDFCNDIFWKDGICVKVEAFLKGLDSDPLRAEGSIALDSVSAFGTLRIGDWSSVSATTPVSAESSPKVTFWLGPSSTGRMGSISSKGLFVPSVAGEAVPVPGDGVRGGPMLGLSYRQVKALANSQPPCRHLQLGPNR